jgi:hypothetical protein
MVINPSHASRRPVQTVDAPDRLTPSHQAAMTKPDALVPDARTVRLRRARGSAARR